MYDTEQKRYDSEGRHTETSPERKCCQVYPSEKQSLLESVATRMIQEDPVLASQVLPLEAQLGVVS